MTRIPSAAVPFLAVALVVLVAEGASAQRSPLSISLRGGAVHPASSFTEPASLGGDVGGGGSFGLHFVYRRGARSKLYVGFSQHRFSCPGSSCGDAGDYVHTGWEVGTRYDLATGPVRPWLRLGGVFARVERNFATDVSETGLSDLSAGLEAGVGVTIPVGGRFALEGVGRFVWLNAGFPAEGLMRMRYFVTDVGLDVRF